MIPIIYIFIFHDVYAIVNENFPICIQVHFSALWYTLLCVSIYFPLTNFILTLFTWLDSILHSAVQQTSISGCINRRFLHTNY